MIYLFFCKILETLLLFSFSLAALCLHPLPFLLLSFSAFQVFLVLFGDLSEWVDGRKLFGIAMLSNVRRLRNTNTSPFLVEGNSLAVGLFGGVLATSQITPLNRGVNPTSYMHGMVSSLSPGLVLRRTAESDEYDAVMSTSFVATNFVETCLAVLWAHIEPSWRDAPAEMRAFGGTTALKNLSSFFRVSLL